MRIGKYVLLTLAFACLTAQAAEQGLVAYWKFDESSGTTTVEQVSGTATEIASNFSSPEWKPGVSGRALRFDGFSTWVTKTVPASEQPTDALTIEAWVALQAYPVSEAAFVNQQSRPSAGYWLGVDKWGKWGLAAAPGGNWVTCWSPERFPKNEWVHVAATFDKAKGMNLYLNGKEVGTARMPSEPIAPDYEQPLMIGRDCHTAFLAHIFPTGMVNGLMDEVQVYRRRLGVEEIRQHSLAAHTSSPDFSVPANRFANDPQRPAYHPIPDANWTNEPHGLVHHGGRYHVFYQKNPNGSYWEQIHWGHLSSVDLLHWVNEPIALAPEPGYDQRGIWSGDCVINGSVPTIVYTGVDGVKAGICLATSDADMKTWRKDPKNPVIPSRPNGFMDFRDPYVWKRNDLWYAVIGAGVPDTGGTALLYRSRDLMQWEYLKPLLVGQKKESGIFWEMPIFIQISKDKWLLYVTTVEEGAPARGLYWIGTWGEELFTPDFNEPRQLDVVNHMLSPSMTIAPDGRVLAIGIVPETRSAGEQLKAGWAHAFSLPRELTLSSAGTLVQRPASELQRLHGPAVIRGRMDILPERPNLLDIAGEQMEIIAQFMPGTAKQFGLRVRSSPDGEEETLVYYDALSGTINLDRTRSSLDKEVQKNIRTGRFPLADNESLMLQVFIDHSVIEVFLNGRDAFATRIYPTRKDSTRIGLYSAGGAATLQSLSAWPMNFAQ